MLGHRVKGPTEKQKSATLLDDRPASESPVLSRRENGCGLDATKAAAPHLEWIHWGPNELLSARNVWTRLASLLAARVVRATTVVGCSYPSVLGIGTRIVTILGARD